MRGESLAARLRSHNNPKQISTERSESRKMGSLETWAQVTTYLGIRDSRVLGPHKVPIPHILGAQSMAIVHWQCTDA